MDKEITPYSVETLISEKDIKKRIIELGEWWLSSRIDR